MYKTKETVMEQSRTRNARRNVLTGFFRHMMVIFLQFLARTVMIHYMGELYAGAHSLFSSILQVLSLTEMGVAEAIVFSMYKPLAENDDGRVCALLNLYRKAYRVIGIAVLVIGLACFPILPHLVKGESPADVSIYVLYGVYLFNIVISYFLFAHKASLLNAAQRMDIRNNIQLFIESLTHVLQIAAMIFTRNYYVYVIFVPLSTIAASVCNEVITRRMYPQYYCKGELPKEEVRTIQKNIAGAFLYKICGRFRNSFDSIIISASLGLSILAKYGNYYTVVSCLAAFIGIFQGSIIAGIGNSLSIETEEKNYRDFCKFEFLMLWITGWMSICLYCLFQPFIRLWMGEHMLLDEGFLLAISCFFFCSHMSDINYAYRQAAGIWWKDKVRPAVEAVANLTLNIVLVRLWGLNGVLLATIICLVLINSVWGGRILFKCTFSDHKVSGYYLQLLAAAAVTFGLGFATSRVCMLLPAMPLMVTLMLRGIICAVVPNALMLILGRMLPGYHEAEEFVLHRLIKR